MLEESSKAILLCLPTFLHVDSAVDVVCLNERDNLYQPAQPFFRRQLVIRHGRQRKTLVRTFVVR